MSLSGAVTYSASGGQSTLILTAASAAGTGVEQIDVSVPASTTDQLYTISIDISELKQIFLYTDGVLTIETNSSSAPDDTFVFAAGYPLCWQSGMPTIDGTSQNPFDADVTKFYLTNGTGSAVKLYGVIIQGTP